MKADIFDLFLIIFYHFCYFLLFFCYFLLSLVISCEFLSFSIVSYHFVSCLNLKQLETNIFFMRLTTALPSWHIPIWPSWRLTHFNLDWMLTVNSWELLYHWKNKADIFQFELGADNHSVRLTSRALSSNKSASSWYWGGVEDWMLAQRPSSSVYRVLCHCIVTKRTER